MSIRQRGRRAALFCGLLLLLVTGGAVVAASATDSPVIVTGVDTDGDRLMVTLLNSEPAVSSIGGWQISTGSTRSILPTKMVLGGFARVTVPVPLPEGEEVESLRVIAPSGETVQVLEDPVHTWTPGDIFSLHGVDRYRYIIVYSQVSGDERVHGCYEVDRTTDGDWVVSQFVHGQEVFSDSFMATEGARFLDSAMLDDVIVTDTTPGNDGQSYYGRTLGSLFGGVADPGPWATPEPTVTPEPTAPHWPVLTPTPTHLPESPTTPGGVPTEMTVTVTPTPATPQQSLTPVPSATTHDPEPTLTAPTDGIAVEPTPTIAPVSPFNQFGSRRTTGWAGYVWSRQPVGITTPSAGPVIEPVPENTRSHGSFSRSYPTWSRWNR